MVLIFIATMYIVFAEFCIFSYGFESVNADPLITSSLPQSSPFVWVVEILFMFKLIFTYPLMLFPAN